MADLKAEITINAPSHEVWGIVGENFADVATWASGVYASRMIHGADRVGPGSTRSCDTFMGTVEETLIEFDHDQRRLVYEAARGMPFFMRKAINRWSVHAAGSAASIVRMHATLDLVPIIGKIMWTILALFIRRRIPVLEDLKHFAETGNVHPRKLNERHKRKTRRAGARRQRSEAGVRE